MPPKLEDGSTTPAPSFKTKFLVPLKEFIQKYRKRCMFVAASIQLITAIALGIQGLCSLAFLILRICDKHFEARCACASAVLGIIGAIFGHFAIAWPHNKKILFIYIFSSILAFLGTLYTIFEIGVCEKYVGFDNNEELCGDDDSSNNETVTAISILPHIKLCLNTPSPWYSLAAVFFTAGTLHIISMLVLCHQWNYYGTESTAATEIECDPPCGAVPKV